jgi:hypothetical protein
MSRDEARRVPTFAKKRPPCRPIFAGSLFLVVDTLHLAQAPVVVTALVSMPLSLNRHPGELAPVDVSARHLT